MFAIIALLGLGVLGAAMSVDGQESASASGTDEDDFEDEEQTMSTEALDLLAPDVEASGETQSFDGPNIVEIDGFMFNQDFLADRNVLQGTKEDDVLSGVSDTMMQTEDHLFGGAGDDHLIGGAGDVLVGGAGLDTFETGQEGGAHILGLEPNEVVILEYEGEVPQLTMDATDTGTTVFLNGQAFVKIESSGPFSLDQIVLRLAS